MRRLVSMIGCLVVVGLLLGAVQAEAGPLCPRHGKKGKHPHGRKALLGSHLVVENRADGAQVTITAPDAEKAAAVKEHLKFMAERKAKGKGCPGPGEWKGHHRGGEGGEKGPCGCGKDCGCEGKSPCGCGKDCGCEGKSPCGCGKDCGCAGKGPCGCGKGCGCEGKGPCGCGKHDKKILCNLLGAEDVVLDVEETPMGGVLVLTSAKAARVKEIQEGLALMAERINNWKPGEGCPCGQGGEAK